MCCSALIEPIWSRKAIICSAALPAAPITATQLLLICPRHVPASVQDGMMVQESMSWNKRHLSCCHPKYKATLLRPKSCAAIAGSGPCNCIAMVMLSQWCNAEHESMHSCKKCTGCMHSRGYVAHVVGPL